MAVQLSLAQKPVVECLNHHIDSRYWEDFRPRNGDAIVCTSYKSGTTWMQQIVQTLFTFQREQNGGDPGAGDAGLDNVHLSCPWVDLSPGATVHPENCPPPFTRQAKMPMIEAMPDRRCLKSHLSAESLPYYPEVKYICVVRDARDAALSLHNHYRSFTDAALKVFGLDPAPEDFKEFYYPWVQGKSAFWNFFTHLQSYYDARGLPNLLLVHFSNLKADLKGQMQRIAEFLQVDVAEDQWAPLVQRCTFEYMKANETHFEAPPVFMKHGMFIHQGRSRWAEIFDNDMLAAYEHTASTELTPACRAFMETGVLASDEK